MTKCAPRILCTLRMYHLGSVPVTSESLMKYTCIARLHLFSVPRRPPGCRGWRWRREAWGDLAQQVWCCNNPRCMGPVAALYLWLSLVKFIYVALHALLFTYIMHTVGYKSIQHTVTALLQNMWLRLHRGTITASQRIAPSDDTLESREIIHRPGSLPLS